MSAAKPQNLADSTSLAEGQQYGRKYFLQKKYEMFVTSHFFWPKSYMYFMFRVKA